MLNLNAGKGWRTHHRGVLGLTGLLVGALLLVTTGSGCVGKVPARKYLALQLDTGAYLPLADERAPAPRPGVGGSPSGCSICVTQFSANSAYETDRLAYRVSPHQLGYYGYWHWVTGPGKLVANELRMDLKRRGMFVRIDPEFGKTARGGLVIGGVVEAMEEVEHGDDVYAHLALTVDVYSADGDFRASDGSRVIWRKNWDLWEKLDEKGPVNVAASMNNLLRTVADQLAAELAGNSLIRAACTPN